MTTVAIFNPNTHVVTVRSRDTELLPEPQPPSPWHEPIPLEETLDNIDISEGNGLTLLLLAAAVDLGPSSNNVGAIVIQRHIAVDGKPVRVVEYELSR